MIKNIYLFILIIILTSISFGINSESNDSEIENSIAGNCKKIPYSFSSYEEARDIILNAKYKFVDKVNTSRSSWIRSAKFLSCDKQYGFFVFTTESGLYIHQDVPIDLWYAFKETDSFGGFYSYYIRGRYILQVY